LEAFATRLRTVPDDPEDEDYDNLVMSDASEDADNNFIASNADEPPSPTPNFRPTRAGMSGA
jgi:hypothetical protein